jgi:hypothetical protein
MTNPTPTPQPATPVAWCRTDDFRDALLKRQSFSGWRERHFDCDMALYAQPQASHPVAAAQAEGPSLADVDELCEEFEFYLEGDGLGILHGMITAAITRWRPAAQPAKPWPVNLAELHDPDFSDGLTPSQHLDVLHGGPDPRTAATASAGHPEPDVNHILRLAAIIRKVDGGNRLGAAALAEAILAHPGFSGCHDGPVASPAQGEVAELVAALEFDAECVAAEQPDLMQLTDKQLTRIAELLKSIPHA